MDMDADVIRFRKWKSEAEDRIAALERRAVSFIASPSTEPSPIASELSVADREEIETLKASVAGIAADMNEMEQALARVEDALAKLQAATKA